jgi:hypothetical protein
VRATDTPKKMSNLGKEDILHKRVTIMADGRRKLYYYTFTSVCAGEKDKSSLKEECCCKRKEAGNE